MRFKYSCLFDAMISSAVSSRSCSAGVWPILSVFSCLLPESADVGLEIISSGMGTVAAAVAAGDFVSGSPAHSGN